MNDKRQVKFNAYLSNSEKCICDACFDVTTVVKIDYPITKYHDGQNITTIHKNVWLCKECAIKLIDTIEEVIE